MRMEGLALPFSILLMSGCAIPVLIESCFWVRPENMRALIRALTNSFFDCFFVFLLREMEFFTFFVIFIGVVPFNVLFLLVLSYNLI